MESVLNILMVLVVLVPSVILHEVAHGFVALRFGDDTAQRAGRLTLNPIAHIDPFGTVLLPALLAFTTGAAFGYAKPVPVNPSRMRRPRDHGLLVSLAGPATNIVLALLAALVLRTLPPTTSETVFGIVLRFGAINVILAAFNLLPIPPLDGSALVERVLPRRMLPRWRQIRQYSMAVLLLVVLLLQSMLNRVFSVAFGLWERLLA
jgi:Zn-dependent protease